MAPLTTPPRSTSASNLLSGVVGGLLVLVVGSILLATGVIDNGGDTKVVHETIAAAPGKSASDTGGRSVADIYKAEGRGVVQVRATGVSGDSIFGIPQQGETATGSGFFVDDKGTIVTNAHVVEGAKNVSIKLTDTGDTIPAQVKGRDTSSDLAVLKIDPSKVKNLRVLPLGSSKQVAVGDPVVGIGFAIPIDTAKSLLPRLKQGGKIERAYLGIEMADVDGQLAHDLNLPVKHGALIQSVVAGGPASKAGLRGGHTQTTQGVTAGGDLIVNVDGHAVSNSDDVAAAINNRKPGDTVAVEYYRGNSKKTAHVKLGKRPNKLQQQSSQGQNSPLPLP